MSTHEMQHQTAGHDGGSGEEEPFDVMDIVAARSRGDLEAQSADMKKEQRSVAQLVVDQATEPEVISGPGPIPLVNRSITDRPSKEGFEQDERKTNEDCGSTSKDAQQELCKFETRQRGSTTRRQSQAMARPGAYAVEPSATEQSETMTPIGVDSLTSSNTSTIVEELGLAVANPVDDDAVRHLSLPQARDFDAEPVASNRSKQKTKQFLRALLSGTILLIVVLLILLAVAALVKKRTATTASPAPSPSTPAPTSAKGYLLSLFDDGTQQALEDPQSPQSRSYEWILEDLDNLPLYSDDQIKQKFALASLYFATGGDNWRNNTNWLNHSVSECNWFFNPEFARKSAISQLLPGYLAGFLEPPPTSPCDNDGLLQHLWLDQNNLEGSIPEELYLLTKLETLSMGWNQLGGTISSHIGQLRALEGLTLSQLLLTGTLPTEVGMVSNLSFFSLHANQLQGDLPTQIWQLTNLVDLILSSNSELKGTLPTDIGALSKLRMLQLERSDFSGTIPTELGQAESLGWCVLNANRFTGQLPSELGKLPGLVSLTAWGNSLEGSVPSELGMAISLFILSIRDNRLTGQLPSELGKLTKLSLNLSLRNNQFSQPIPTELGLLTGLQRLELSNNQFSGHVPSEFGKLTSMGRMTLANNSLSGPLPKELLSLKQSLFHLELEGNPTLSGTIPPDLCTLNGTCYGSFVMPCMGPFGLSFECTGVLCGCGCSCMNGSGR